MGAPVLYVDTFWISPYVFTSFVALREKRVAFDTRAIALESGEQRKDAYVQQTIVARIPALVHDDFVVTESSAIAEYIDEVFSPERAIMPKKPRDRARARQVMSWIRSDDTMPLRDQRPTHTMFYDRATTPLTDKAKRTADKLFAIVEHFVSGDSLFDSWCIADSDLAFMIHRLLRNGDNVPDRVRVYAEHQWKRASVHEFVTRERVPYVAY